MEKIMDLQAFKLLDKEERTKAIRPYTRKQLQKMCRGLLLPDCGNLIDLRNRLIHTKYQ